MVVRSNRWPVLAMLACLGATPALAGSLPAPQLPEACASARHDAVASRLQHLVDSIAANPRTRGALLHVECGQQEWTVAAGVADLQTGRPIRPDDRFRAGSILKPAIAAVVLQLVEEGKLSLDDPITRRLPPRLSAGLKDADAITVRMLLDHRSGMGEWTDNPRVTPIIQQNFHKVWTPEDYVALAVEQGPQFKPGAAYAYNNTGYVLLGAIIEQVTGRSWRDNVLDRIFKPIGLDAAALPKEGVSADASRFAHGYMLVEGKEMDMTDIDPSMAGPAGGHAFSPTTTELSHFLDALLAGRFFKKRETLDLMMDFGATGETPAHRPKGYGLGLMRFDYPEGVTGVGHTGSTAGYLSFTFLIPERGVTMTGAITGETGPDVFRLGTETRQILLSPMP